MRKGEKMRKLHVLIMVLFMTLMAAFLYAQDVLQEQKKDNSPSGNKGVMEKANEAASELMKLKMKMDAPLDYKVLKNVKDADVIVVRGVYDHLQDVLNMANVPYTLVEPEQVDELELSSDQFLMVNCPGSSIDERGIKNIENFVKKGGYLFTTDWAVKHVLEKGFPGYVRYNEHPTTDDVVRIEVKDFKNPFVKALFQKGSDPVWWLETSSYPIEVLEPKKVNVLIISEEMKNKYGENPIALTFSYGKGRIFHMTSHFYLQRAELRTERHKKSAKEYATDELKLSPEQMKGMGGKLEGVNLGEVESAYTSQQFIANILVEQQKEKKGVSAMNAVALADITLKEKPEKNAKVAAKIKKGEKVILLKQESKEWALVETSEGKKGYVSYKMLSKQ